MADENKIKQVDVLNAFRKKLSGVVMKFSEGDNKVEAELMAGTLFALAAGISSSYCSAILVNSGKIKMGDGENPKNN